MKYNFLDRILHKLFLHNKTLKKTLFDIECSLVNNKNFINNRKHIFISSLPRSGTTLMLNFIYSFNFYASLTYRDMPFIMAPNLFSFITNKNNIIKKERYHADGIFFDLDSPESFDEVFFKTFDNKKNNSLENYDKFINNILNKYNKELYLSKNNLNYKRIDNILKLFPNSIFFITFRDPLDQVESLIFQHNNFLKLQKNSFILEYMNLIGHNEFGRGHLAWNKPIYFKNLSDKNYWLEQWYLFYKSVLSLINYENVYFISYEKLCYDKLLRSKILDILNIKDENKFEFKYSGSKAKDKNYNLNLLDKSKELYDLLLSKSL